MKDKATEPVKGRALAAGSGFVIACLTGLIGIFAAVSLWLNGANALIILLVYLATPAVMIGVLYLLSSFRAKPRRNPADKDALAVARKGQSGQI